MKTLIETSLVGALLMMLAACGSGGSGGSDSEQDMEADPAASGVETIFSANRDSDPASIANAVALGAEIDRIFGSENAESIGLDAGDSIADIFNRARNG